MCQSVRKVNKCDHCEDPKRWAASLCSSIRFVFITYVGYRPMQSGACYAAAARPLRNALNDHDAKPMQSREYRTLAYGGWGAPRTLITKKPPRLGFILFVVRHPCSQPWYDGRIVASWPLAPSLASPWPRSSSCLKLDDSCWYVSGVALANQTKERSVHELFAGAFRNKSSMWIVLVFQRKNTRIHKNGRNSWTFRFGPFFGLVCRGDFWM